MFSSWIIPSNPAKCAASNQTVACNYVLYSNATSLDDRHKLLPNDEVTGKTIVKAFIAGAAIAVVLSFCLLLDKIKVHWFDKRRGAGARREHNFYLKAVNTLENLLHVNSDQQLVTSIALLLSINHQACEITSYHFNIACTMLLMGIVTHLNTLISIPDFLYKGKAVAFYRCLGIVVQLILSGIVFSARHSKTWPAKASSIAILPAACFENMNATNGLGFGDFADFAQNVTAGSTANTTANVTQIQHNIDVATSATSGMGEYATLVVFMVFALLILGLDWCEAKFTESIKHPIGMRWTSIFFSGASILASSAIIGISYTRYNTLRTGMEIPQWYKSADEDEWTYSQILPILLMGSGSIAALKAMTESFGGIRGRRYELHAKKLASEAQRCYSDAERSMANLKPMFP